MIKTNIVKRWVVRNEEGYLSVWLSKKILKMTWGELEKADMHRSQAGAIKQSLCYGGWPVEVRGDIKYQDGLFEEKWTLP